MTMTQTTTAKFVKSPRGLNRKVVDLLALEAPHALGGEGIPDLWHIAESQPEIAKMLLAFKLLYAVVDQERLEEFLDEDDGLTAEEIDNLGGEVAGYEPLMQTKGAKAKENILAAWHIAHDLKARAILMAQRLQPILDLLDRVESGESKGASGCYAAGDDGEAVLNRVIVPVELLRAVRDVHTGVEPKKDD